MPSMVVARRPSALTSAPFDPQARQARATGNDTGKNGPEDTEKDMFGADGLTFADVLDVVNPLQHIPLVSHVYREATGDTIADGPKMMGATLFGGPVGLLASSADVALKRETGRDAIGHLVAALEESDHPSAHVPMPEATGLPERSGSLAPPSIEIPEFHPVADGAGDGVSQFVNADTDMDVAFIESSGAAPEPTRAQDSSAPSAPGAPSSRQRSGTAGAGQIPPTAFQGGGSFNNSFDPARAEATARTGQGVPARNLSRGRLESEAPVSAGVGQGSVRGSTRGTVSAGRFVTAPFQFDPSLSPSSPSHRLNRGGYVGTGRNDTVPAHEVPTHPSAEANRTEGRRSDTGRVPGGRIDNDTLNTLLQPQIEAARDVQQNNDASQPAPRPDGQRGLTEPSRSPSPAGRSPAPASPSAQPNLPQQQPPASADGFYDQMMRGLQAYEALRGQHRQDQ